MVHVATPRPSIGASLGAALGGLGAQEYGRYRTKSDIQNLRERSQNANPTDLAFNLAEAAALNPSVGRAIGPLYQTLMGAIQSKAMANVPAGIQGGIGAGGQTPTYEAEHQIRQGVSPQQEGEQKFKPSEQTSKFYPSNVGAQEAPGNLPQSSTKGIVRPILNGDELIGEAQNQLQRWQQGGLINKTLEDAYNLVNTQNEANKSYNQQVEADRSNRIAEQDAFGNIAEEALNNVLPEATDEQKAVLRKKGEEFAGKGKSQAEIKRSLALEASRFKNTLSNIQNGLSAPRIQNKLQRKLAGNEKNIEQAQADARIQIQPLLNEGLYDTSRLLLSKAGFYPEEREDTIFGKIKPDMKKAINEIPKPKFEDTAVRGKPGSPGFGIKLKGEKIYTPESKANLKENIKSVWGPEKNNDSFNVIQNRKAYEDKNYDWRIYKDVMNELFSEGEIDFNQDQLNQFNSYLNEPPLTMLESIFEFLHLRGR